MAKTNVNSKGKPVDVVYSNIFMHSSLPDKECCSLEINFGNDEIAFSFESGDEMIEFCKEHNFPYEDNREKGAGYVFQ